MPPITSQRRRIYLETWAAEYGSPNQIDDSFQPTDLATIPAEEPFGFVDPGVPNDIPLAFIDGIQQVEASVVQELDGQVIPGLACAYAVGAVTIAVGERPQFAHLRPERLLIWTAGSTGTMPAVPGGWRWREVSIPLTGPKAANAEMERQRKVGEAALGHQLEDEDWWVICDGTDGRLFIPRANGRQRRIMGCIKSQHVQLLPQEEHHELTKLPERYRTTLFRTPSNRYSCYFRLAQPKSWESPLSAILRLEFSGNFDLVELRTVANAFTAVLPTYAGVAHVDPRAPQNLQPIGALETHLRRMLGDPELTKRALYDAIGMNE